MWAAFVCLPLGLVYAVRLHVMLEPPVGIGLAALILGLSATCALALGLLRKGASVDCALHLVLVYVFGLCVVLSYFLGGLHGPAPYWLLILPSVALFLGSTRSGLAYLFACELVYVGYGSLALSEYGLPDPPPRDVAAQLWLGSLTGLSITLLALVLAFERAKEHALDMLRRANGALIRARDHAYRASQSKSEFLARVSHEIRTPMTAILGFAELLASRLTGSDPALAMLEKIQRNAHHLLGLINDILDLSRIEAGRLEIELQSCDPRALVADVVGLMQDRARAQDVALREECAPEVPARILADPRRLKQVLINLTGNAVKFSTGGEVVVSLRPVDGEERRLRFEVRDQGIGIPADQIARLFQPFQQVDASMARRYGGTGLGLSITRRLVEMMAGEIHVESTPGVGSTFRVDLPVVEPREAGTTPDSAQTAAAPAGLRLRGAPHVLFADDVADNRALVEEVLRETGAQVTVVCDGTQALEHARAATRAFDVVLLDIEMPGANGFEVARGLREDGYAGVILALTARGLLDERARCLEAGFDGMLFKPFERRALIEAIDQASQGRSAWQASLQGARAEVSAPPPDEGSDEGWLGRLVLSFVPTSLRADPVQRYRARIVVGLSFAPPPLSLLWSAVAPHTLAAPAGTWFSWLLGLMAPMMMTLPFILRRSGSVDLVSNLVCGYTFALLAAIAYCSGGPTAPSSYWLIVIPLATPVLGVRNGIRWTCASLVVIAAFFVSERMGWPAPNYVIPETLEQVTLLNIVTLCLMATSMTLIAERTHRAAIEHIAAANRQLGAARMAAEQASQAKSAFIANVSHEIRTPMTAILGFAEVLVDEWHEVDPGSDLRQKLAIIHKNGGHLIALINDLLDLSRIEAGGVELERIPFDPSALCHEAAELMREPANAKGLELRAEVSSCVPARVRGDPLRVRQVLLNLIGNAVKFTPEGSVTVRLGWSDGTLRVEVEDTGPGLSRAEQEALFLPFNQGAGSGDPSAAGSGLGLAISRLLCELMGGQIGVTSAPHEGSCFHFAIPAERAQATPDLAPDTLGADAAPVAHRVLLAEDGRDNQVLITHLLRKAGMDVTVAGDGQAAVEAVEAAREMGAAFDLVLMDIQMPVLDGFAATRELRRRGHDLPVVALTAHAFAEEQVRCIEAGCDAFATKPIDRKTLVALVRHWATQKKATAESEGSR